MLSPKTVENHEKAFELLLRRFPELTSNMLDEDHLTEFFAWLQTRRRMVGRGMSAAGIKKGTVATYWRRLNRFFGWLCMRRIIAQNPLRAEGMRCPKVYYEDKQFLERPQMERIMGAISFGIRWKNNLVRTRNLALISTAANCGLRRGELLALRVAAVDLVKNELTVEGATSKSRSTRTIPLNSRARADIESYLKERRASGYGTPYLWVSDREDRELAVDGMRRIVAIIGAKAGVKFHLHQLRHTFAVNFLHNTGVNSFKLQRLLGHRSIVSTAIYTRCLPVRGVRADLERLSDLTNTV